MECKFKILILASALFLILLSLNTYAAAPFALSDQGTDVKTISGTTVASGNLSIEVWDANASGTLVWNRTYVNGIANGTWNVMIGELSALNLDYGKKYWKDYAINEEDVNFTDGNGNLVDRQFWYSPLGEINGSFVNESSLRFTNIIPISSNTYTVGNTTHEWKTLYVGQNKTSGIYFGLGQESNIYYNSSQAKLIMKSLVSNISIVTPELQIWDNAEGANDYVSIYHDGTVGRFYSQSGDLHFEAGGAAFRWTGQELRPGTANVRSLGTSSYEWEDLFIGEDAGSGTYYGLDQDVQIWYNNTNASLFIESSSANVSVVAPEFRVWDDARGDGDYLSLYHDGTNGYIRSMTGNVVLMDDNGMSIQWDGNNFYPGNADMRGLGSTSKEWEKLYLSEDASSGAYFGLDQDWRLYYNESAEDALFLENSTGHELMTWKGDKVGIGT
ncbi:hypothetical protein KY314_01955, partial [Candidatus Woesearchaeota archaeon]|nr:hypothetical protein [Candidatus Woesearchaeota archaeon]